MGRRVCAGYGLGMRSPARSNVASRCSTSTHIQQLPMSLLVLLLCLLAVRTSSAQRTLVVRPLVQSAELARPQQADDHDLTARERTLAALRNLPPPQFIFPTYGDKPPPGPLAPPEGSPPPPPPPPPPRVARPPSPPPPTPPKPPNPKSPKPPKPSPPQPVQAPYQPPSPSVPSMPPPPPPPPTPAPKLTSPPPAAVPSPSPTSTLSPPPPTSTPSPPPPTSGPSAWTLPPTADAFTNYLWGANGELWSPQGRLTDYSYAGYMANESPLPQGPVTIDVSSYGAVGDGINDDTFAFVAAIAAISSGVIFVPAGRYLLSQQIVIQKSGVVLRGAGSGSTTLYFTKSLTDLYGQSWSGYGEGTALQSDYKDGPGLIRFAGPSSLNLAGVGHVQIGVDDPVSAATLVTKVTQPAKRGDVKVFVSGTSLLKAGQWVTLALSDAASSLLAALYGYIPVPRTCSADCVDGRRVMRFHSRIFSVRAGYIVLERPLPWDISLQWTPEVHVMQPGIQLSGIEEMTIEFKWAKYSGHLLEAGWNGVEFAGAKNCWAKNLVFLNSDNPLIIWKSSFVTASGLKFGVTKTRGAYACHHNVNVTWSQDVLVTNFQINQKCVHDVSSFAWNNAVVFSNGTGVSINMDHHLLFPYATLWSNINVGAGDRAFLNAGEPKWGMASAALTTYYNIQATKTIASIPSITNGPYSNFLRVQWGPPKGLPAAGTASQGWLVDQAINPPAGIVATPVDLHSAFIRTRQARFIQLGREFF